MKHAHRFRTERVPFLVVIDADGLANVGASNGNNPNLTFSRAMTLRSSASHGRRRAPGDLRQAQQFSGTHKASESAYCVMRTTREARRRSSYRLEIESVHPIQLAPGDRSWRELHRQITHRPADR